MARPKKKKAAPKKLAPWDILVLEKLDAMDKKLNVILSKLGKLEEAGNNLIIPELETQINRAVAIVQKIDRMVPDQTSIT